MHGWQYLTDADKETILKGIVDGRVYGGPFHLEIDWVDRCNARCFFCNSEGIHNGQIAPWEIVRNWIDGTPDLRSIRLAGGGEPTLHPNLADLLTLLGQRGVALDNLTTNGTALTGHVIDALAKTRVNEILVSMNYPTGDTYEQHMGLPARIFDQLLKNLQNLREARKNGTRLNRLILQFFIHKPTVGLIRDSYALAQELGADVITYREISGVEESHNFTSSEVPAITEAFREIIRDDWQARKIECHLHSHGMDRQVSQIYQELSKEFGAHLSDSGNVNVESRYCYIPWYSMTIVGNQAVYPCCFFLLGGEEKSLGKLENRSIAEMWHGPEFDLFRKEMRQYFLFQRPLPFFEKRVKAIVPHCASHNCPMSRFLCDDNFYGQMEERLAQVRRNPSVRLWRLANRAASWVERHVIPKS